MKKSEADRILAQMERVREASYEAETPAEEARLIKEYDRLWRSVAKYVEAKKRYTPEDANA